MRDHVDIGPTPAEEPCEQLGSDYNPQKALHECRLFIELIRETFGPEPDGARLRIKSSPHDFGNYIEVVCDFDTDKPESQKYAYAIEADAPMTWNDKTKREWR